MVSFTSMPGVSVLGEKPWRASWPGPPISIAHCSGLPSWPGTITKIQACGLTHWNSFTVPESVIFWLASNIAKE